MLLFGSGIQIPHQNEWFSGLCFRKIYQLRCLCRYGIIHHGVNCNQQYLQIIFNVTSILDCCGHYCNLKWYGNVDAAALEVYTRRLLSCRRCLYLRPVYPELCQCYHSRADHGCKFLPNFLTIWGATEAAVLTNHLTYYILFTDYYHITHLLFRIVWCRQWRFLLFCHYHWSPADTPNFWDDMHTNAISCLRKTN